MEYRILGPLEASGDFAAAVSAGFRAVELFTDMPDPLRHARALTALADAHDGLGHHSQAEDCRCEALTIFTRLGVPEAESLKAKLDARPR